MKKIRVTIWNEDDDNQAAYPEGIHNCIAGFLRETENLEVKTSTLSAPECGVSAELLENTDVLIWWAHSKHHLLSDEATERIKERVLAGMGFLVLHSGHGSKPFHALLGTHTVRLRWRDGDHERVWTVDPTHAITQGIDEAIEIPESEMYGEWFRVPAPDELVFISWYSGGEVFRSGCCWKRELGKIFFFSPGHEGFRIYDNPQIRKVIINAVNWAAPLSYKTPFYDHAPVSPEETYKAANK